MEDDFHVNDNVSQPYDDETFSYLLVTDNNEVMLMGWKIIGTLKSEEEGKVLCNRLCYCLLQEGKSQQKSSRMKYSCRGLVCFVESVTT